MSNFQRQPICKWTCVDCGAKVVHLVEAFGRDLCYKCAFADEARLLAMRDEYEAREAQQA